MDEIDVWGGWRKAISDSLDPDLKALWDSKEIKAPETFLMVQLIRFGKILANPPMVVIDDGSIAPALPPGALQLPKRGKKK